MDEEKIQTWKIGTPILLIIGIIVIIIIMNSLAPTIGNVFEYGPDLEGVNWACIERNNCSLCGEANWDTRWCFECLEKCRGIFK